MIAFLFCIRPSLYPTLSHIVSLSYVDIVSMLIAPLLAFTKMWSTATVFHAGVAHRLLCNQHRAPIAVHIACCLQPAPASLPCWIVPALINLNARYGPRLGLCTAGTLDQAGRYDLQHGQPACSVPFSCGPARRAACIGTCPVGPQYPDSRRGQACRGCGPHSILARQAGSVTRQVSTYPTEYIAFMTNI